MNGTKKIAGLLKLSSRTYRARPLRTFLTVFGMSIGMGAVLLLVSLGYGLQAELLKRITTEDSLYTLTVTVPPASDSQTPPLHRQAIDRFSMADGVAETSAARISEGFVRLGDVSGAVSVFGVTPEYLRLAGYEFLAGEGFESSDYDGGIVVSAALARTFHLDPEVLVGEGVTIRSAKKDLDDARGDSPQNKTFTVAAVVDVSDPIVYLLSNDAKDFVDASRPYSEVRIRASSEGVMERIRTELLDEGYEVSVIADIVRQVNIFFTIVQFILGFFGVIALIVSAVGMFNTMTVALLERTREIGIMKSIGATDRYIALLFIAESFIMGLLGGVLGIMMAFAGMGIINFLVNIAASQLGGELLDLFESPLWFIVLILIVSGVVGVVTGLVPARKASKLDPLAALQYK